LTESLQWESLVALNCHSSELTLNPAPDHQRLLARLLKPKTNIQIRLIMTLALGHQKRNLLLHHLQLILKSHNIINQNLVLASHDQDF
jgi:hypothetical protein